MDSGRVESRQKAHGFWASSLPPTDPRAEILRDVAGVTAEKNLFALARQVEETGNRVLREYRPERRLYTNVEFYSAVVMHSVGLPPDLFTSTFAASRSVGWTANVLEQVANNRLIRPQIEYTGPMNRKVEPINQR